jgi:hypothetical protein
MREQEVVVVVGAASVAVIAVVVVRPLGTEMAAVTVMRIWMQ